MKTSNRILLGLVIIVFATPFLLAATLKYKIKKGDFIVKKQETHNKEDNSHMGSFTAFKVVKVIAPGPSFISCHVKESTNMSYQYFAFNDRDSVSVYTANDTLFVRYIAVKQGKNGEQNRYGNGTRVDIKLPSLTNLVIDGAEVVLDSVPSASGGFPVILKNNGILKQDNHDPVIIETSAMNSKNAVQQDEDIAINDIIKEARLRMLQTEDLAILNTEMKYFLTFHFM